MIVTVASDWSRAKMAIEHNIGIGSDLLHVYVGMLLLLGIVLLLSGRRVSLRVSWLIVLAFECFNEALDLSRPPGSVESDLASSLHDLFTTMFLPTVLLVLWPSLMRALTAQPGEPDAEGMADSNRS